MENMKKELTKFLESFTKHSNGLLSADEIAEGLLSKGWVKNDTQTTQIENKQVQKCVCRCYGHTHKIKIQLQFDCCCININPKRNWFSSKGFDKLGHEECSMPFYDLFDVFDIDCEDGVDFESISGKYCRLHIDKDREIVAIQHISKDKFVLVKDLQ